MNPALASVTPSDPNGIPTNLYRPDIDGLRAVAVLAVLIHHWWPSVLPGGFLGVDIFFVISGYVITTALLRQDLPGLGDFLLRFYARRVKRLLP
ncbi:MAG: acyltransferase, partial [Xanthomonadales bacterium]|nr:acyltransferase [Xanthomonadales bacterium]